MTDAALSYVHGATSVPLIGETIGANFDRDRGTLGRTAGAGGTPAGRAVDLSASWANEWMRSPPG